MAGGKVVGIKVTKAAGQGVDAPGEERVIPCAAVLLATGGFAANRTLLQVGVRCCR